MAYVAYVFFKSFCLVEFRSINDSSIKMNISALPKSKLFRENGKLSINRTLLHMTQHSTAQIPLNIVLLNSQTF